MTPTWVVRLYKKAPLRRIQAFEGSGPEYAIRLACGHASNARLSDVRRIDAYGVPYTVQASVVDPSTLPRQRCRTCCEIMWPELSGDTLLYGDRINKHLDGETIAPMPLPSDVLVALSAQHNIDLHYDHVAALRGRYLGPCDCHLLARTGDDGAHSDLPDLTCPKCQGDGERYARKET